MLDDDLLQFREDVLVARYELLISLALVLQFLPQRRMAFLKVRDDLIELSSSFDDFVVLRSPRKSVTGRKRKGRKERRNETQAFEALSHIVHDRRDVGIAEVHPVDTTREVVVRLDHSELVLLGVHEKTWCQRGRQEGEFEGRRRSDARA